MGVLKQKTGPIGPVLVEIERVSVATLQLPPQTPLLDVSAE